MIKAGQAFQAAITADTRRILLQAIIDIIDPDITYGAVTSSGEIAWSRSAQLHDKDFSAPPAYVTLEHNRWLLGGQFQVFPDSAEGFDAPLGFIGDALSDADAAMDEFVQLNFSNVTILQACSVWFSTQPWDGIPVDFTVEVLQGGTAYFTETVTGNAATEVSFDGFTVNNPDAIRVTVTKWSKPSRRLRTVEIVPGIYELWDNSILAEFNVAQQANFSGLALPYGTCSLSMDNLDRRFEPRSKSGIFQSIEERQGIQVFIGARLPDGSDAMVQVGVFYQFSGGWKTGDNGITMHWDLVDIVGLLADRQYLPPTALPTTLDGWIASIVAQLGVNFEGRYVVDPDYAGLALTVTDASKVASISCGELLRYACMATGTFPRANAEGLLAVEPYWSEGNKYNLDNLTAYPVMRANDDLAAIIFTLDNDAEYIVSGNSTASNKTVQVKNPFLHTQAEALTAARLILSTYGGNQYDLTGRGNPSSEIGDVDTIWLDESQATVARRMMQTFNISNGILVNCQSQLLQADGSFLFESRAVLTASGSWTAPAGVTKLRLILVGHGEDGTDGTDGSFSAAGVAGTDGLGALVWAGTIDINPQQVFQAIIGGPGEPTTFGAYSSANGQRYDNGYTDIASGDSYARTGVQAPLPGSGDGGAGGQAGRQGQRHYETTYDKDGKPIGSHSVTDVEPTDGTPGVPGATGCIVIYWDKEAAT